MRPIWLHHRNRDGRLRPVPAVDSGTFAYFRVGTRVARVPSPSESRLRECLFPIDTIEFCEAGAWPAGDLAHAD